MDYLSSQVWEGPKIEIIMDFKEGNLRDFVNIHSESSYDHSPTVLLHILQALDYLAVQGIVHPCVAPSKIFYTLRQEKYSFQLGGFGLGHRRPKPLEANDHFPAERRALPVFAAPEMIQHGTQTHKGNVWSLMVTLLWMYDRNDFQLACNNFLSYKEAQERILSTIPVVDPHYRHIEAMARIDPEERASAAQILLRWLDGRGLTTPRSQITPLVELTKANVEVPVAESQVTSLTSSTKTDIAVPVEGSQTTPLVSSTKAHVEVPTEGSQITSLVISTKTDFEVPVDGSQTTPLVSSTKPDIEVPIEGSQITPQVGSTGVDGEVLDITDQSQTQSEQASKQGKSRLRVACGSYYRKYREKK